MEVREEFNMTDDERSSFCTLITAVLSNGQGMEVASEYKCHTLTVYRPSDLRHFRLP